MGNGGCTVDMLVRGKMVGNAETRDIRIKDGRVTSIRSIGSKRADLGSRHSFIAPVLFDIQVNGWGGIDLQSPTLMVDDVWRLTHCMAMHGVGYWIPTLITGPLEVMERTCRVIVEARRSPAVRRAIPGIHVEGPFISPQDGARGAHAKDFVRKPNLHEFDRLQEAAEGAIRYITVAPEWDGAPDFIRAVVAQGVVVALGHHNASEEHIAAAVEAGARLCTHLGNGLASMIHRHFNPLWPQLAEDRLAAGFIADLEHLPAPVLKSFVRVKGPERTILTSDCVHIAGLKPGRYSLGGMAVELLPTGRICLSGTDLLAGSSLMLLQGVVNAARVTDLTLEQAVACATSVPAKVLGVRLHFKHPRAGEKAEFIVFDIKKDATNWHAILRGVFIDGKFVDRQETAG